jgi:putative flippase GtrA
MNTMTDRKEKRKTILLWGGLVLFILSFIICGLVFNISKLLYQGIGILVGVVLSYFLLKFLYWLEDRKSLKTNGRLR